METNEVNEIVSKLPPPIFIKTQIQNYQHFCEKIKNIIEPTDDFTCKSSTESLKINTTSSNAYRSIIKYLKESKVEFFTYQLKENKPYRIVIRNLHPTISPDYINEELEKEGFQARNVTTLFIETTVTPELTATTIRDVSVVVKTTELTHVPKVENSLPNALYVMEITQQIIADVLYSKTFRNFEKTITKQKQH
ncbi:hypothetical protein QTP88_014821 [Uroleucon formosanum]